MSRTLVALAVLTLATGCRAPDSARPDAAATEPAALTPSVPTPEGWSRADVGGLGSVFRPASGDPLAGRARLIITTSELTLETSATPEVVAKAMAAWRDLSRPGARFELLGLEWVDLDGHRAVVIDARLVDPQGSLRLRQYCLLGPTRQWVLTLETDAETLPKVLPLLQRMVDGVTFDGEGGRFDE